LTFTAIYFLLLNS